MDILLEIINLCGQAHYAAKRCAGRGQKLVVFCYGQTYEWVLSC
jgi:hypothetical protein